jgi:mono/diheme cytochrome c family protein
MSADSSPARSRKGPWAIAVLVAVTILGLGLWWIRDAAEERRITEALAPYAGAPLPEAGSPRDSALAEVGARLFRKRCSACHAITGESRVGPDLAGVTERRDYRWIGAMILSPDSMTREDSVARSLKEEFGVQMLTPRAFNGTHVLAIVEFLRRVDAR